MPPFSELFKSIRSAPTAAMLALAVLLICGLFGWIKSEDAAKDRALEKANIDRDLAQKEKNALVLSCAQNLIDSERRHQSEKDSIYRTSLAATNEMLKTVLTMKKEIKYLKTR